MWSTNGLTIVYTGLEFCRFRPPAGAVRLLLAGAVFLVPTGCSGQLCADEDVITTCEFSPEYACYAEHGECAMQGGSCGWTRTAELSACLEDPTPEPDTCRATGCSGQLCASEDLASTCEFLPEYACYQEHGVCEAQDDGACGWTPTDELNMCLADA